MARIITRRGCVPQTDEGAVNQPFALLPVEAGHGIKPDVVTTPGIRSVGDRGA